MSIPKLLCMISLWLAMAPATAADIYRWTDANGRVHFGDAPPKTQAAQSVPLHYNRMEALPERVTLPKVVLYSAEWCGVCRDAKAFLKARGVPYTEYDVETNRQGRADYQRLQGSGVPIILVGEERLNGFRSSSLTAALQRAGHLPATP